MISTLLASLPHLADTSLLDVSPRISMRAPLINCQKSFVLFPHFAKIENHESTVSLSTTINIAMKASLNLYTSDDVPCLCVMKVDNFL